MAGKVFPLFAPLVLMMVMPLGLEARSSLQVPWSDPSPVTVTSYFSLSILSVMLFSTASGMGFPLNSALAGAQLPCSALVSGVSAASAVNDTTTARERQRMGFILYSGWSFRVILHCRLSRRMTEGGTQENVAKNLLFLLRVSALQAKFVWHFCFMGISVR